MFNGTRRPRYGLGGRGMRCGSGVYGGRGMRRGFGARCFGPFSGQGFGPGYGFGNPNGQGYGYSPVCVCPNCGAELLHEPSIPCSEYNCPECGTPMVGAYCSGY